MQDFEGWKYWYWCIGRPVGISLMPGSRLGLGGSVGGGSVKNGHFENNTVVVGQKDRRVRQRTSDP